MSSRSGVAVDNDVIIKFDDLKLKKKFKYLIYSLSANKAEIVVSDSSDDTETSPEAAYEKFLGKLPEGECRWAVYDFNFSKGEDGERSKICFIAWSPDTAKVKDKMTYASSKDALRRALNGIAIEVQGSDYDEVAYYTILDKCSRGR